VARQGLEEASPEVTDENEEKIEEVIPEYIWAQEKYGRS